MGTTAAGIEYLKQEELGLASDVLGGRPLVCEQATTSLAAAQAML